ncbi:ArsR/SmtB family transcription factor [Arthrobacter cavernae]|uniref:Metalloregulator ArsR/SmtB family transcription factor n=1 Tax=Arthrobacter cavernae TaxID=2817681 RepID=A0A939KLS8_9MICC|nr:metalloregulator ArsR/SmtB family transcription factor [Arthrobacter cavernae]MBO1267568.1 metalloregulator ArsR/SmtB family transcription factor [Arthrobacter cavernae]
MGDRLAKDRLFDAFASVAKVLGSGRRAEIVDVLAQGERAVDEIAGEIGQGIANTSQHLQQLLRAGMVCTRREGTRIYYRLSGPAVERLWVAVRQVASEHVAELDELAASYFGDRAAMDTLTRAELSKRMAAGDVVVLDVRPEPEFRSGHIPGAVSVPIRDLAGRLKDLPHGRTIVAYCRGQYCVFADEAVRMLRQLGMPAARLEEGYPEWAAARLPVESGAPRAAAGRV